MMLFDLQSVELIANYDDQAIAKTFKFGVLYQKFGQVCC